MGVKVKSLAIAVSGGRTPVTFSDTFNRANTTNGFGPNWLGAAGPSGVNYVTAESPGWKITANQAVAFQPSNGTPGDSSGFCFLPRSTIQGLWGRSQFAQITFISAVGDNNSRAGVAVMFSNDTSQNGYSVEKAAAYGGIALAVRRCNVAGTVLFFQSGALTSGDVVRLVVTAGAALNFVNLLVNGVSQGSLTDSNAARPVLIGAPGMFIRTMSLATNTETMDDFSCGPA